MTPSPSNTPPPHCVYRIEYWKTRSWPVNELYLGSNSYTRQQLLDMMHDSSETNGFRYLVRALVSTKLNILNGVNAPQEIKTVIDNAHNLIGDKVPPPYGSGELRVNDVRLIVDVLTKFNEGHGTVPSCSDYAVETPVYDTNVPIPTGGYSGPTQPDTNTPTNGNPKGTNEGSYPTNGSPKGTNGPVGTTTATTRTIQNQYPTSQTNPPDDSFPEAQSNSGSQLKSIFSFLFRRW